MGGLSVAADENYFPTAYSMESVSNGFFFFSMCAIVDVFEDVFNDSGATTFLWKIDVQYD